MSRQDTIEFTGKDGAPMVLIPAGTFIMGSRGEWNERPEFPVSEFQRLEGVAPIPCSAMTTEMPAGESNVIPVQATMCPSGQATCRTFSCGANGIYCCPASHPYLSHCDCQCYNASPNCQSYSACSR